MSTTTFTFHNQLPTSIDDQEELRKALLECEVMKDHNDCNTIMQMVCADTKTPIPDQLTKPSMRLQAILTWCNNYPKSITTLLRAVISFGSSIPVKTATETFGKIYCDIFVSAGNGITYDHLSKLKKILHEVTLDIVDVRTAFERSVGDNRLKHTNHEREFRALLWTATREKKLNSGRMPLVSFVQALAELAPAKSAELRQWCEEVGEELGVDITKPQPVRSTQPHKDPCLQIVVEVGEDKAETLAETDIINVSSQIWWNDVEADCSSVAPRETTLRNLPTVVDECLRACSECLDDLTIEVFLPYALLKQYAVEEWWVKTGFNNKKYFRKFHPLVLRSSTRIEDVSYRGELKKRWEQLQHLAQNQELMLPSEAVVWVCQNDLSTIKPVYEGTIIGAALLVQAKTMAYVMTEEGEEVELLAHLLIQGMPMVLWSRHALSGDDEHYRTPIHGSAPHRIPRTVLEQRKHHSLHWQHVALLWDNPNRIPHYFDDQKAETPLSKRSS